MPQNGPAIAVINLPGLARSLVRAGFNVIGNGLSSTDEVIDTVRAMSPNDGKHIIVVGIADPKLKTWTSVQATDVPVVVVHSTHFDKGAGIPSVRNVDLPCMANAIMAEFKAPPSPLLEGVEIDTDGTQVGETPEHSVDDDKFDVFKATPETENIDVESETESPPARSRASIFAEPSGPVEPTKYLTPITPGSSVFDTPPTASPSAPRDQASSIPNPRSVRWPAAESSEPSTIDVPPLPDFTADIEREPQSPRVARSVDSRRDLSPSAMSAFATNAPAQREHLGTLVFTLAGKGGVSKTTTALALAERARFVEPGLRTIAIDANRGQPDFITVLKLDESGAPTIYDMAISRRPEAASVALINPKRLNEYRGDRAPLRMGVILSPEQGQASLDIISSDVYLSAINYARSVADLVVVDTQIVESFDTSGLIDQVVVPLLANGAWGLGLASSDTMSVKNLEWVLRNFIERGVPANHLMFALNKVSPDTVIDTENMTNLVSEYSTWMGAVRIDPAIERLMNLGEIPGSSQLDPVAEYAEMLDRVLYRVTGITAFAPQPMSSGRGATTTKRRLFRGRR